MIKHRNMNKVIVNQEIDQIMETIAEQWEIMRNHKNRIPLIEVDIFKDNIRNLYELLLYLEKMNAEGLNEIENLPAEKNRVPLAAPVPQPAPELVAEQPSFRPAVDHEIIQEPTPEPIAELPTFQPAMVHEAVQEPSEPDSLPDPPLEIVSNPSSEDTFSTLSFEDNSDQIADDMMPFSPPQAFSEPPLPPRNNPNSAMPDLFGSHTTSLADKYQDDKKTIKDQLSDREDDNSIGSKMQQSQINDLKSAIGINDKFLFINELFKGDLAGYNRTIENLNASLTRHDATEKLDAMRIQYKWSEQSTSLQRLRNFLRRRFPE